MVYDHRNRRRKAVEQAQRRPRTSEATANTPAIPDPPLGGSVTVEREPRSPKGPMFGGHQFDGTRSAQRGARPCGNASG